MRKLLTRGIAPPLHPDAERILLKDQGLGDQTMSTEASGDVGPCLLRPRELGAGAFTVPGGDAGTFDEDMVGADDGMIDPLSGEPEFLRWVFGQMPPVLRWLTPQPPLDLLVKAGRTVDRTNHPNRENYERRSGDPNGDRRCDFLFSLPGTEPVVFEVDGGQHEEQEAEDRARDSDLLDVGIDTIRIPTSELRQGTGPALRAVKEVLQRWQDRTDTEIEPLVWAPIQVHRLVLGLCEAIDAGWLDGDRWHVKVSDPTGLATDLIGPYLGLLDALDCLWGGRETLPSSVEFTCTDRRLVYVRTATGRYEAAGSDRPPADHSDVRILLECDRTPCEPMPDEEGIPAVVIRSTGVPMLMSDNPTGPPTRIEPFESCGDEAPRAALEAVLRAVFAKAGFREGQFEAITEVLAGRDCAVLLPTGAGKSLIYQLSGLCLPGTTLVVDPLVALMEDQIDSLRRYGIERAVGISSRTRNMPREPGDAYFIFVTPERLQRQRFRNELAAAAQATPVNLAVVDEAHCVSEWGHDFRPAYLNFGTTLREVCTGSLGKPPLLALTGTASRPVLKDVLFQLDIAHERENSIVRPSTFDRPELSYRVVLANPADRAAKLEGELRGMPGRFGAVAATFFEPTSRDDTYSGIVFVPTATGSSGVTETWEKIRRLAGTAVRYSGRAPNGCDKGDWDLQKSRNAQTFKQNGASVVVTTKAFGMGIDKPNVRWIVHYGLPGSIEAFYQEVGRAGRDGRAAWSVWILTDRDREANARFLSTGGSSSSRDDVDTALYFHKGSFPSQRDEHRALLRMFDKLESDSRRVPLGADGDSSAAKRALHRLAMLSVVDDYCLEGAGHSEIAVVRHRERTPADVVEGLLRFVERSVPGRLDAMRAAADIRYKNLREAVDCCGRLLIEFVYDTIEGARRRSLREMWLVAGEAESDGEILRARILGYLTEGDIARRVEDLAERSPFAFADWQQAWAAMGAHDVARGEPSLGESSPDDAAGILVSESDAQEWRSAAARLLASYPDHPGLLASRGLAEAMLPGGDLHEFDKHLKQSLASAPDSYNATERDVERLLLWLCQLFAGDTDNGTPTNAVEAALGRSPADPPADLAASVVGSSQQTGTAPDSLRDWLDEHWHAGPQLAVLKLAGVLDFACELALTSMTRFDRNSHG